MPLYEHVYLARQDLSAQQVEELTAKLAGIIGENGGKITKTEYWGMKSLNYRIRKNRKAHMTLLNVDAAPAALSELERQERLNEDVLRYLTIRVEEHEEGPSAMMRKVERDDRRGEAHAQRGNERHDPARQGRDAGCRDTFEGVRGSPAPRDVQQHQSRRRDEAPVLLPDRDHQREAGESEAERAEHDGGERAHHHPPGAHDLRAELRAEQREAIVHQAGEAGEQAAHGKA